MVGLDLVTCSDRGSALPVIAGVLVLVGLCGLGLTRLGVAVTDSARARTAADAAALAAVSGGEPAARALAAANGARLVRCVCAGDPVEVTVVVDSVNGDVEATARASARP